MHTRIRACTHTQSRIIHAHLRTAHTRILKTEGKLTESRNAGILVLDTKPKGCSEIEIKTKGQDVWHSR